MGEDKKEEKREEEAKRSQIFIYFSAESYKGAFKAYKSIILRE